MSVDVEIYMTNIKKFFKENPKDLFNLIPRDKEIEFFSKIRQAASSNHENGKDVSLTQKQLIEICKDLNKKQPVDLIETKVFQKTKFGEICLN